MKPGFYNDIPADRYHADALGDEPSLSSGVARILMRESPLKAWHSHPRLNPGYRENNDAKFDLGTAAHAMMLEDDESSIVIVEADDWRTKAAKEQREAANAAGKTALLARHFDAVEVMVEAARKFVASSEIADLWNADDAASEVTGIAVDGGVRLRCRFDRLSIARSFLGDYKTTGNVEPEAFSRLMVSMGYHFQDAFYSRCARILGIARPRFVFLAQSTEPPHECSLHGCDPALLEIADAEVELAIGMWRACLGRKEWPSYGGRVHWALPPTYLIKDHEQRIIEEATA